MRETIEEIRQYDPAMAERPRILVVNKLDVTGVRQRREEMAQALEDAGLPVYFISAATGEGVSELLGKVLETLAPLRRPAAVPPTPSPVRVRQRHEKEAAAVERDGRVLVVHHPTAERIVARVDVDDYRVRVQLVREFGRLGVTRALERAGVKRGDIVRIAGKEMEW
jgi:GTP-binding protein